MQGQRAQLPALGALDSLDPGRHDVLSVWTLIACNPRPVPSYWASQHVIPTRLFASWSGGCPTEWSMDSSLTWQVRTTSWASNDRRFAERHRAAKSGTVMSTVSFGSISMHPGAPACKGETTTDPVRSFATLACQNKDCRQSRVGTQKPNAVWTGSLRQPQLERREFSNLFKLTPPAQPANRGVRRTHLCIDYSTNRADSLAHWRRSRQAMLQ